MTKTEFNRALAIAQDMDIPLLGIHEDVNIMGYGLEGFTPVETTIMSAAEAIRYQCLQFNGAFDNEELNKVRHDFVVRNKVLIEGLGSDAIEQGCQTLDFINEFVKEISNDASGN